MLRVDRNVRFGEDYLWLHVDRDVELRRQAQTLLHFDQSAEIQAESLNLLHADRISRFYEIGLALQIDPYAQFRKERPGGIFSEKLYCFYWWNGTKRVQYGQTWSKERFRSLVAQQQKDPIPLTTDSKSGRTWWMFRGQIYWEDFSARELEDGRRAKPDVLAEIRITFLEGTKNINGFSRKIFRFQCQIDEQVKLQSEFLTEQQYQTLLAKQQEIPVRVLCNNENCKSWWMFKDKIYWEKASLDEGEVSRLFLEGVTKADGIAKETYYHFQRKRRVREEKHSDQFWTEKQYQALIARQHESPFQLCNDNGATWWMFRNRIYWTEVVRTEEEVKSLFAKWAPSPDGSLRKTSYHFYGGLDTSKNKQEGFWTEEQYLSLFAKQQVDPVRMRSDHKSGKTWWMFQGKFYWEDYSSEQTKDLAEREVKGHFLEGNWKTDAISRKIYRSQRKQVGQDYKSVGHWTENGYQALLAKQLEDPVPVLWNEEGGRKWWMFRDKFYWEDEDLKEIEVKALLLERFRKKEQQIERAMRSMEQESRRPSVKGLIPDYVKRQVWRRDGGLCARCRVHCGREENSVYVHIVPVSQGGRTTVDNIQLLCDMCDFPF